MIKNNIPLLLGNTRVHCDRREVTLLEQLVQFCSSLSALHKDNGLVELQLIKQLIEFAVLLLLIQLDVVLLKTVQGKFGLVINIDFKRVLHELLADRADFLGKSGAEHHDLLLSWGGAEDLLNIASHVLQMLVV